MKKIVFMLISGFLFASLAFVQTNGEAVSLVLSNQTAGISNAQMSNVVKTNTEKTPKVSKSAKSRWLAGISEFIRMGGIFIWPLLVLSILGVAYLLERRAVYLGRKVSDETLLNLIKGGASSSEVKSYLETHPSRMGDIIAEIIRLSEKRNSVEQLDKVLEIGINIQVLELQKGFTMIGAVINLAPLVGFLGTVSGMIAAFASIATSDQVSVTLVAKGIQEALITTEVGLVIAITVNFFYSLFQQSIEKLGQYSIDAGETLIERIIEDEN